LQPSNARDPSTLKEIEDSNIFKEDKDFKVNKVKNVF